MNICAIPYLHKVLPCTSTARLSNLNDTFLYIYIREVCNPLLYKELPHHTHMSTSKRFFEWLVYVYIRNCNPSSVHWPVFFFSATTHIWECDYIQNSLLYIRNVTLLQGIVRHTSSVQLDIWESVTCKHYHFCIWENCNPFLQGIVKHFFSATKHLSDSVYVKRMTSFYTLHLPT